MVDGTGERQYNEFTKTCSEEAEAAVVTIKDISRACGVSTSTVSKVLNGYTDISRETVDLVFRTAGEMGYTPNAAARQLIHPIDGRRYYAGNRS